MDCTWSTHIDGGKPRPAPVRAAGNIEESHESPTAPETAAAEKPLGHLTIEINALDDEDDWSDPWEEMGNDPWGESLRCPPCDTQIPTLQDLYGAREVCQICKDAGVYQRMMEQQRVDQYIIPQPPSATTTPLKEPQTSI